MGAYVSRANYEWSYTEEPHATRRKEMLKKYPEIQDLYGLDPAFVPVVLSMVFVQILMAILLKSSDWTLILLQAYISGGVINHSLTLAIHEISHNMAFGHKKHLQNRYFGMLANLPIAFPYSISFKKYHIEHHVHMGEDGLDTDVPTEFEARIFNTTCRKLVWLIFQVFFYALRPIILYRKSVSDLEVINVVIQLLFNYGIYQMFGIKSLLYLLLCSFLSLGLHPTAGHFIAEHYVFRPGQETYSYYGPLNLVTFNVGLHIEHHDFPNIAGINLPKLRQIAPEYYDIYMHHTSWVWVLWQYVFNPDLGPYARIKRNLHTPANRGTPGTIQKLIVSCAVQAFNGWQRLSQGFALSKKVA